MFGNRRRRAASNPVRVNYFLMDPEIATAPSHCLGIENATWAGPSTTCQKATRETITDNVFLQHINASTPSASAAMAASQAFLRDQASNASLSAAAAATALRSRPTTPVSVADVQTKRTIKRANSNSSAGSSVAGSGRGPPGSQLVRRGSSGSMSERTFRDPSPARTSAPVPSAPNAPPVPTIPQHMQQSQMAATAKPHRRATSLEAPAMRVASPPPAKPSGRGSSLGPTGTVPSSRRKGHNAPNLSSVQERIGVERPASRGSVNFSLPTGSRSTSPTLQRRLTSKSPSRANIAIIVSPTNQNLVYDPNTRSFLPEAELLAIEQRIQNAANKGVKKKKRAPQAAGTHLAHGTAGGRPRGTAIDAIEAAAKLNVTPIEPAATSPHADPVPVPVLPALSSPRKKSKKVVVSDSESDQGSYAPNSSDTDSDAAPKQNFNTRSGAILVKKPSVVREDVEREEQEDDSPERLKFQNATPIIGNSPASERTTSPSPLARSVAGRGHGRGQAAVSTTFAQERLHTRSASQPAPSMGATTNGIHGTSNEGQDSIKGGRVQSVSPVRTTHFANALESLVVKHQPPARSISPRKSALKHSSSVSPRGQSPIGNSLGLAQDSEASVASDELAVPKKRANRVSFDESHVVVGEAASPMVTDSPTVHSPQSKRPWYSIGRGKKKDILIIDDDEIMKPRPALPMFGSIRERKLSREVTEERPLVKPSEPVEPPKFEVSLPSPPLFTTSSGETVEHPDGSLGQSNDHVIGAILSQDAASRNEANISRSREPLPPQVTSVEGSGYHSDSDSSLYDTENSKSDVGIARANSMKRGPDGVNAETYRALTSPIQELDTPVEEKPEHLLNGEVPETNEGNVDEEVSEIDGEIPEIAVLGATPTLESTSTKKEWPDMPGSWGSFTDECSSQDGDVPAPSDHFVPNTVGTIQTASKITPISIPTGDVLTPKHSPVVAPILEEPEESDADIYTDAAEELTDTEGDGFMSLDAMVESPVSKASIQSLTIASPPDSPASKIIKERAHQQSQLTRQNSKPGINDGWDKVQAYWNALSADRKNQLELEARQEEDESDTEIEAKPAPKPKKKKVVSLLPPAVIPQPQSHQTMASLERTYMIQPGVKAGPNGNVSIRTSMRPEPVNTLGETHMRKSMRGDGSMRGSLRTDAPQPRGSLQKKYRPMSSPAEVKADPVEVNKHVQALSIASAKLTSSPAPRVKASAAIALRRRGSGDSDSSFKRFRASSDAPAFRRSMRTSIEQDRLQSPMRSSRFSLRSLSPTGSTFRRPFGSTSGPPPVSTQNHMRTSMRSSFDITPSLRSNYNLRGSGFGRSKASKPTKLGAVAPRSSRFADSSDEEEDDRPPFRSRFDSSDEDEPGPTPSSIPRTTRSASMFVKRTTYDGDSSDLPDSDDERPPSAGLKLSKKRAQNGSTTVTTNQGSALASGSLRRSGSGRETIQSPSASGLAIAPTRPNQTRRGSIMSILRRKKPDQGSKIRKSDIESAARRDTPLERSKSDLAAVRTDRPHTPKLQKRPSGAWPLPAAAGPRNIVGAENDRPFTADTADGVTRAGANGATRPDLGTRRFTATGLTEVDILGAEGKGKRKKKFGKLRRIFGLDD
jgi:serine/arginine repetitive matrix protein 2